MEPLSVTDLATRVLLGASEAEMAMAVRQLRYWTLERIFPTINPSSIKTGKGKHREYDERTIPFAAVAVELGNRFKLNAEQLRKVMLSLWLFVEGPSMDRDEYQRLWRGAIDGTVDDVWLVIQIPRTPSAPVIALDVVNTAQIHGYLAIEHVASTLLVNLSRLFARVRS